MLKKYFLTKLQVFDLHIGGGGGGVYCKLCLQPISCFLQSFLDDRIFLS